MTAIKELSRDALHELVSHHNWDEGYGPLRAALQSPNCDRGTALWIYWHAAPESLRTYANAAEAKGDAERFNLVMWIHELYLNGTFGEATIAYDPTSPEDMTGLYPESDADAKWQVPNAMRLVSTEVDPQAGLRSAIVAGDEAAFREWLGKGGDATWADPSGVTPLMVAVERNRAFAIEALLEVGADANAVDRAALSALHRAAKKGHVTAVKALLAAGADPNVETRGGRRPLHDVKNARIAALLVEAGADPDARDTLDQSPLTFAEARRGKTASELAAYLVGVQGEPEEAEELEEVAEEAEEEAEPGEGEGEVERSRVVIAVIGAAVFLLIWIMFK